ncbi:MAG: hypothetical protein F9K16_12495 [Thermoanaerobaculia bacterium]|nr:MAG: hypothetical protein F9K16_12495 [Thermoanaerobaculia bacterium]MBZ0103228.1 hypothetical protein [Thermoanaerobaculia bacterium]
MKGPTDKAAGMKTAYERALERLEAQGIERPDLDALSEAAREAIAEARKVTEARLAELEILHADKMAHLADPLARAEQEEFRRREREQIERDGEAKIARLRRGEA